MARGQKSFVVLSQAGCLLPFLITFNLFFGWMFLSRRHWLFLEAGLILVFLVNSVVITRRLFSAAASSPRRDGVIDVEGQVVEEDKRKSQ